MKSGKRSKNVPNQAQKSSKTKAGSNYHRIPKHVELSFEDEIEFATNEFDEDGLENLSSEGNEWDDSSSYANPPKVSTNILSRNNSQMGDMMYFKTDKPNNSRNYLFNGDFLSNKFTQSKLNHADDQHELIREGVKSPGNYQNTRNQCQQFRRSTNKNSKAQLNRSRNKSRHNDSSGMNLATSSILEDKLRDTLTSFSSQTKAAKRYAKNLKNLEKEMDQEKLQQKSEIKQKVKSDKSKAVSNKKSVNCQILGNLIKNNINDFAVKSKVHVEKPAKKKATEVISHESPVKNNDKENRIGNSKDNSAQKNTEVYDLNQY